MFELSMPWWEFVLRAAVVYVVLISLVTVERRRHLRKHRRDSWMRYQIGFLRYEDSLVGSVDRVTWEYMPHQVDMIPLNLLLYELFIHLNLSQRSPDTRCRLGN